LCQISKYKHWKCGCGWPTHNKLNATRKEIVRARKLWNQNKKNHKEGIANFFYLEQQQLLKE